MRYSEECDESARGRQSDAIVQRLLKARTVMIAGDVDQDMAEEVISQLLVLDSESHDPIRIIVTSNGGHVDSGFAIHDVLRFVRSKVIGIGAGWVASIAVPILFGARKENRFALPNTRFLLHQPSGGAGGRASDLRIEMDEILKVRDRLNRMISEETGQTAEKVAHDTDRNFWMNAQEALEYGLISRIVSSASDLE